MRGPASIAVTTLAAGIIGSGMALGQAVSERTVWDGLYTEQQGKRGQAEYLRSCASCHADDLRGRGSAPSLVEESFAFQWDDLSVGDLLERTQKLMPSDRPNSLSAQSYRDIIAFILQSNRFPAGDQDLDPDLDALRKVRITTKPPEPRR
jgi:mono/diheme cytochrome c family protein